MFIVVGIFLLVIIFVRWCRNIIDKLFGKDNMVSLKIVFIIKLINEENEGKGVIVLFGFFVGWCICIVCIRGVGGYGSWVW